MKLRPVKYDLVFCFQSDIRKCCGRRGEKRILHNYYWGVGFKYISKCFRITTKSTICVRSDLTTSRSSTTGCRSTLLMTTTHRSSAKCAPSARMWPSKQRPCFYIILHLIINDNYIADWNVIFSFSESTCDNIKCIFFLFKQSIKIEQVIQQR